MMLAGGAAFVPKAPLPYPPENQLVIFAGKSCSFERICFVFQGGFPVAPLTPSEPNFWVPFEMKTACLSTFGKRLLASEGDAKGCRGRPQSPLRNLSKEDTFIRRGGEGVQRATAKPSGSNFIENKDVPQKKDARRVPRVSERLCASGA